MVFVILSFQILLDQKTVSFYRNSRHYWSNWLQQLLLLQLLLITWFVTFPCLVLTSSGLLLSIVFPSLGSVHVLVHLLILFVQLFLVNIFWTLHVRYKNWGGLLLGAHKTHLVERLGKVCLRIGCCIGPLSGGHLVSTNCFDRSIWQVGALSFGKFRNLLGWKLKTGVS